MTQKNLQQYYYQEEPEIDERATDLFVHYVGLSKNKILNHVKAVRSKAWAVFPYPCIGRFKFMTMESFDLPVSQEVKRRLNTGNETLLDLGCCLGQDIRSFVFEGALAENLTGYELEKEFVDFGYDLFLDREKLKSKFVIGDFFQRNCGLQDGAFDLIHASSFFHLFNWDEQLEAVSKAVRLLKPKEGSMIFGQQIGSKEAGSLAHGSTRSGEMFRHDPQTFKGLVDEVARREGKRLRVDVGLTEMKNKSLQAEGYLLLQYSITVG